MKNSEIQKNMKKSSSSKKLKKSGSESNKSKKSKKRSFEEEKEAASTTCENRRTPFKRIFSERDEIGLLIGMFEYSVKNKVDPIAHMTAFHEFIKKDLDLVDPSRAQLLDKVRRLKKKYLNNNRKEKDGKPMIFSKVHEAQSYKLSKKIWGNENVGVDLCRVMQDFGAQELEAYMKYRDVISRRAQFVVDHLKVN